MVALIELVGESDSLTISGDDVAIDEGIVLDKSPTGIFGTGFTTKLIEPAGMIGGREGQVSVPVRQFVGAFDIWDEGDGVAAQVARFRKLWGTMYARHWVRWEYTSELSGKRWCRMKLAREIEFTPEQDWEIDGVAHAVVTANAFEPRYESEPHTVLATNPAAGEHTIWLPVWNPTDQDAWLEWELDPKGTAEFAIPDFGWGREQDIDRSWTPGMHDDRMVSLVPISVPWSVRSVRSGQDPYLAADLSNASGLMGGVFPLYSIPPYTGTKNDPVMVPVIIDGSAGAEALLTIRRFWSAESGLEA